MLSFWTRHICRIPYPDLPRRHEVPDYFGDRRCGGPRLGDCAFIGLAQLAWAHGRAQKRQPSDRLRATLVMPSTTPIDWATGISHPLYQLAAAGADDDELERFLDARKRGDIERAARILSAPREARAPPPVSDLGPELDDVLQRVKIAALRQVVNDIDVRLLHRYIELVWHVSKHVVTALKDAPFWSSERAILAVGNVVSKVALDQVHGQGRSE